MRQNLDLIRQILCSVEEYPHGFFQGPLKINGHSEEEIGYHCYLILEAGLASGSDITTNGDASPNAVITHLTGKGHEFVDAARSQTMWNQAKEIGRKAGVLTLATLGTLLMELAVKMIQKQLAGE